MSGGFQSVVNQTQALGVVGDIYSNAPLIADTGIIVSSDPTQNIIGRAFTLSTGATANPAPSNASVVQVGGTGTFFGILANSKTYASTGVAGNPLGATLNLPNNSIGQFVTAADIVVQLANPANIGDLVTYNVLTGELDSVAPTVTFTGVIAVTTGVLTASAVTGQLYVGAPISGALVPGGTFITALGSGTGGAGTYQTNIVTAVASSAMTAPAQPQQASSFTGVIAVTTGILTVSAITAGTPFIGAELIGTGVPAGTYITGAIDSTHWQTNIITAVASTTMTTSGFAFVPGGKVTRISVPSTSMPSLAVISMNNGSR